MQQWYVVQTKPRQERVAEENLKRQGFQCYCPMIAVERRYRKRWTTTTEPLFSRYLFISLDRNLDDFSPIRSTVGVLAMVRFGLEPAVIPNAVVESIRYNETSLTNNVVLDSQWQTGRRFKIAEGPMAGLEAIYQLDQGNERAIVLLQMLGKEARVSVERNNLVPV